MLYVAVFLAGKARPLELFSDLLLNKHQNSKPLISTKWKHLFDRIQPPTFLRIITQGFLHLGILWNYESRPILGKNSALLIMEILPRSSHSLGSTRSSGRAKWVDYAGAEFERLLTLSSYRSLAHPPLILLSFDHFTSGKLKQPLTIQSCAPGVDIYT